jgi:hypothetical protein
MASNPWAAVPAFSNSANWPCIQGPGVGGGHTPFTYVCTPTSIGSTPNVFTITVGTARDFEMVLGEVAGVISPVSTTNPVAGNSNNILFSGTQTATTSQTSNPIYLYQTGCSTYFLEGFMTGDMAIGNDPEHFVVSAPFYTRALAYKPAEFSGLFDGTTTLCDAIDNVSLNATTVNTYTPHTAAWAWAVTQPYQYPTDLQDQGSFYIPGGVLGSTQIFNEPTTNGSIVVSANATEGPWSISSTPSLTWTKALGCGNSDVDCVFVTFGVPAGAVSIAVNSGTELFLNFVKFSKFTGIDVKQLAISATLHTPVSVTSTGANEFGMFGSFTNGTVTGSNNLVTPNAGTFPNQNLPGSSDNYGNTVYTFNAPTIASYGGTCTADDLGGSGTGCAIIIFNYSAPPALAQQPHVTVAWDNLMQTLQDFRGYR